MVVCYRHPRKRIPLVRLGSGRMRALGNRRRPQQTACVGPAGRGPSRGLRAAAPEFWFCGTTEPPWFGLRVLGGVRSSVSLQELLLESKQFPYLPLAKIWGHFSWSRLEWSWHQVGGARDAAQPSRVPTPPESDLPPVPPVLGIESVEQGDLWILEHSMGLGTELCGGSWNSGRMSW